MTDLETTAVVALRDLLLEAREHVHARDARALARLLRGLRQVNVRGRFLTPAELAARLATLAEAIDRPAVQLVRVEDLEVSAERALGSYLLDLSYVDLRTWREVQTSALLTLDLRRRGGSFMLEGLTFTELPAGLRAATAAHFADGGLLGSALSGRGAADASFYSFMSYPSSPPPQP